MANGATSKRAPAHAAPDANARAKKARRVDIGTQWVHTGAASPAAAVTAIPSAVPATSSPPVDQRLPTDIALCIDEDGGDDEGDNLDEDWDDSAGENANSVLESDADNRADELFEPPAASSTTASAQASSSPRKADGGQIRIPNVYRYQALDVMAVRCIFD